MNGLNVLGFSSTGFDWWLDNNVSVQSQQHKSSSWLGSLGGSSAKFRLCLHGPSCPPSAYSVSKGISIVLCSHTWSQRVRNVCSAQACRHSLSPLFHLQVTASGRVYSVLPFCFINLPFLLLNCAVSVFCEATGSCSVLKVEIAYPVDDVEQQEGGGEEDTRVCVQFK